MNGRRKDFTLFQLDAFFPDSTVGVCGHGVGGERGKGRGAATGARHDDGDGKSEREGCLRGRAFVRVCQIAGARGVEEERRSRSRRKYIDLSPGRDTRRVTSDHWK